MHPTIEKAMRDVDRYDEMKDFEAAHAVEDNLLWDFVTLVSRSESNSRHAQELLDWHNKKKCNFRYYGR